METMELLKELGMESAHKVVNDKLELQRKMHLAYNGYEFVSQEKIDHFNAELKKKTLVIYDRNTKEIRKKVDTRKWNELVYDQLVFCALQDYKQVPPLDVLRKVKAAKDVACFDAFEVAKIESIKEIVDPIVFGRVNGCTDRFFIAQWDEDVKFEDLQSQNVSI